MFEWATLGFWYCYFYWLYPNMQRQDSCPFFLMARPSNLSSGIRDLTGMMRRVEKLENENFILKGKRETLDVWCLLWSRHDFYLTIVCFSLIKRLLDNGSCSRFGLSMCDCEWLFDIFNSLEVHITIKHNLKENVLNKWHGPM